MLSSIPPYQCCHCYHMIHWSDTIHEENCSENPKNRNMKFESDDDSPQEKIQHDSEAFDFGGAQKHFRQTKNKGSTGRMAMFDKRNGVISCQYCEQEFSGIQNQALIYRNQHEHLCSSNPQCSRSCRYCGLTFMTTISTPAKMQSFIHESNCKLNPRNHCRYCR